MTSVISERGDQSVNSGLAFFILEINGKIHQSLLMRNVTWPTL